jgi:hypothetical protein
MDYWLNSFNPSFYSSMGEFNFDIPGYSQDGAQTNIRSTATDEQQRC